MVKRIAPVVSVVLLAACGAVCQNVGQSLPDAPSVQAATQAEKFHTFVDEARSLSTPGAVGVNASLIRETEPRHFTPGPQSSFTAVCRTVPMQKESSTFFRKYLYPSLLKQNLRYHPSGSVSFMGRATDAASRIFIARDQSGKGRLNTSYFLGALTSVAVHTAYRPYWARSTSEPFSNFGSTISNDAGMNLLHEFAPGIQQLVTSHAPKFAARIGERVAHQ
jgi:hypothetical protein